MFVRKGNQGGNKYLKRNEKGVIRRFKLGPNKSNTCIMYEYS